MKLDHRWVIALGCSLVLGSACGKDDNGRGEGFDNNPPGPGPGGGDDGADDGDPGDDGGDDGGSGGDDGGDDGGTGDSGAGDDGDTGGDSDTGQSGDDGGIRFDVGDMEDIPFDPGDGSDEGCKKIDFLFVIDNSGSMQDEQNALAASFPGFIDAIRNTVMAQDYHIMAIDTDAGGGGGCFSSTCCSANCATWCPQCMAGGCNCTCNNVACPAPPGQNDCDITLGAGKTKDNANADCGIVGGNRYMLETQPNLDTTFSCAAIVGTTGDGNEKPMEAMVESVTTLNAVGECNEGFVRDDAILVVTFITDEEDLGKSAGNPTTWKNALVGAKNGDENAVVVLGLLGDTNVPGGLCMPYNNGGQGAEDAPTLRQFADSWMFGQWASVCEMDYAPFFAQAVSVVDTACDEYVPPG